MTAQAFEGLSTELPAPPPFIRVVGSLPWSAATGSLSGDSFRRKSSRAPRCVPGFLHDFVQNQQVFELFRYR